MPQASAGFSISSSAQVGADVILTGNIKNGEIIDADVSNSAAIAGAKIQALSVGANAGVIPSTGIIDAHIAAGAAIVDTKLATISTAGKVSGAALTSLSSIPGGAGVIPAANLPASAQQYNSGGATYDLSLSSGNFNIAHGLGQIPKGVEVWVMYSCSAQAGICYAHGVWNGTAGFYESSSYDSTVGTILRKVDTTFKLNASTAGSASYTQATIGMNGTNIVLAFTKTGSPTGSVVLIWKAWY